MDPWWDEDGVASELLDQLEAVGIVDIAGVLSPDAPTWQEVRHERGQELQGAGGGFFATVLSLPGADRDLLLYLRSVMTDEHVPDGLKLSLEQQYYGCVFGTDWAVLVDRETGFGENVLDGVREDIFDALGPGHTLWWNDTARSGQHELDGDEACDVLLQPATGYGNIIPLVIAEPVDNAKRLYNWIVDPAGVRSDALWQGATVMIAENSTGIARQWTVLGPSGNPIGMAK